MEQDKDSFIEPFRPSHRGTNEENTKPVSEQNTLLVTVENSRIGVFSLEGQGRTPAPGHFFRSSDNIDLDNTLSSEKPFHQELSESVRGSS